MNRKNLLQLFGFLILLCARSVLFGEIRRIYPAIFFDHEKLVYKVNLFGPQVGIQTIFFDSQTNYQGKTLQVGRGSTTSTPFFKSIYPVNDKETSFFSTNDFLPVYYEREVSEGSWKDHWCFYFKEGNCFQYKMQSRNNRLTTVKITEPLYNYITLIQILRNSDADWYIKHNKTFNIKYLFGEKIIDSNFSVSRIQMNIEGKKKTLFEMKETRGLGLILRYFDDETRIPYQLVLPGYTVPGFKTINIVATLTKRKLQH